MVHRCKYTYDLRCGHLCDCEYFLLSVCRLRIMIRLIVRSLVYYLRSHLVVMLAVAVSTAVIGGALIVGDSIRASLRQMTMSRLGGISHVLHSPRFVRQQLAEEIAKGSLASKCRFAPALLLTGSIDRTGENDTIHRASGVTVVGIDSAGWDFLRHGDAAEPEADGIVLGSRTASELQVKVGDQVSVWVELPSSIPRDSLLGEREETSVEMVLTVTAILKESDGASRFSLQPTQQLPHNAFLSLATFQQRLNLEERIPSPRNPESRPARINTILAGTPASEMPMDSAISQEMQQLVKADSELSEGVKLELARLISAADVGLKIRRIEDRGYLSVESDSMILEDPIATAVLDAAESVGAEAFPTLVYLANEINAANRTDPASRYSMYSIVAGLSFDQPEPLGPFRLRDGAAIPALKDNEIILSHWLAEDLKVAVGDTVHARWHEVGSHGDLPETHQAFAVRGILAADDQRSIDRDLTPFVDGVTNVESFSDWDQPFEMEMDRITQRDDEYWEDHRATPKAFVGLAAAEKYWASRFGRYTSIRVASNGIVLPAERLLILEMWMSEAIKPRLKPEALGLGFRPIRIEGLMAAVGANDFSQLFLGFSFFLILSAILLAALMFQLGIRQRVAQIGLLEALGFPSSKARRIFVTEGMLVALLGVIGGTVLAIRFATLMIHGLTTWWVGAIGTTFLQLDLQPVRLVTAGLISLVLAGGVVWNAVRSTSRRSPRELLAGQTSEDEVSTGVSFWDRLLKLALPVSLICAVGLPVAAAGELLPSTEAFGGLSWRVVGFFLAGFSWLAAGLLLLRSSLVRRTGDSVEGSTVNSLTGLSIANAARSPQRSLLTAALIAFATFVIVAVAAGRRNPVSEVPDLKSGNGGFSLVAESSQPVLFNLNTRDGQTKLGLNLSPESTLPADTRIFSFRTRLGQDASCLNLFQTSVPTLLGAMPEFLDRGGFRFANTPGENPWTLLNGKLPATSVAAGQTAPGDTVPTIPVIGDMNTLQFSLKKSMGDVIWFPSEQSPQFALQIVGMLDASIFQGVLVMSDENLQRVAPETSGAQYFLIETADPTTMDQTAALLETVLQPFGMDTQRVSQRLADFLAVQNTYLSTFQMLGGLGLLVGTFGLAAVMLRNVIERRSEIGLLRSLGFRSGRIIWLLLAENSMLLLCGILTGLCSALIAMLPHLLSKGADVPWMELAATLLAVSVTGSLAVIFPAWTALRVSVRDVLTAH